MGIGMSIVSTGVMLLIQIVVLALLWTTYNAFTKNLSTTAQGDPLISFVTIDYILVAAVMASFAGLVLLILLICSFTEIAIPHFIVAITNLLNLAISAALTMLAILILEVIDAATSTTGITNLTLSSADQTVLKGQTGELWAVLGLSLVGTIIATMTVVHKSESAPRIAASASAAKSLKSSAYDRAYNTAKKHLATKMSKKLANVDKPKTAEKPKDSPQKEKHEFEW